MVLKHTFEKFGNDDMAQLEADNLDFKKAMDNVEMLQLGDVDDNESSNSKDCCLFSASIFCTASSPNDGCPLLQSLGEGANNVVSTHCCNATLFCVTAKCTTC